MGVCSHQQQLAARHLQAQVPGHMQHPPAAAIMTVVLISCPKGVLKSGLVLRIQQKVAAVVPWYAVVFRCL